MINIACVSEGTIHSEELSKQYLETIKVSNKQIDSVHKGKPKGRSGSRNKQCPTSRGGVCGNCGSKHLPYKCKAYCKKCHGCGKPNHYQSMCRSQNCSQSQHKGNSTTKQNGAKQNQQRQS